jgi:DNA mismatch repair protein MutL
MPKIRVLSDQVANQIAAGEVVDRPASVLKELVENALDAGAGRLEVRWEEGGKKLLELADDGCGMGRDDLYLALERHATSKVRTAEDLAHLESFGFRGEALPSIASVTRLELLSAEEDGGGHRLRCEFGIIKEVLPAPRARGTTLTVRDLFAQVPTCVGCSRAWPWPPRRCIGCCARTAAANWCCPRSRTPEPGWARCWASAWPAWCGSTRGRRPGRCTAMCRRPS